MAYLRIANFWKYQNADVWKKSLGHPPWYKHFVHHDRELYNLPPLARLLFYELLAAASRNQNVLEDDLNWLYAETRLDVETIREHLPCLLKGGWLSQTKTPRRSRKSSRNNRDESLEAIRTDVDVEIPPSPPNLKKLLTLARNVAPTMSMEELVQYLGSEGLDDLTARRIATEAKEAA